MTQLNIAVFSHCWYSMHQTAGKGANKSSVLQLLGDNPKDDKNWSFVVDGTKECPFDGGYVSC